MCKANQLGEGIWRACLRRLSVFLVERHPRYDAHHVVEGHSWRLTTGRLGPKFEKKIPEKLSERQELGRHPSEPQ